MFRTKAHFERHSDSAEQCDSATIEIEQRIQKKKKELKETYVRIDLIEEERELDEKLREANALESFLSKNSTARREDYINEINIATDDIVKALAFRKLDEDGAKLVRFTMRIIAEENMRNKLCNVELNIYFSPYDKVTVLKGARKQKIIVLFDEKNEPAFRWEIKESHVRS